MVKMNKWTVYRQCAQLWFVVGAMLWGQEKFATLTYKGRMVPLSFPLHFPKACSRTMELWQAGMISWDRQALPPSWMKLEFPDEQKVLLVAKVVRAQANS